ncbi:MAG: hypothetical protein WBG19_00750 [Thermoplasmata archaeon]
MSAAHDDLAKFGSDPKDSPVLQEELDDIEARLDAVRAEKKAALSDPGPGWSEWFFFHGAKWYIFVAFLVAYAWEVGYLFPPESAPAYLVGPLLGATVYAEFLTYQYLWYRPSAHPSRSVRVGKFRPSVFRPVEYGRWTPETAALRAGHPVVSIEEGPDPREFV